MTEKDPGWDESFDDGFKKDLRFEGDFDFEEDFASLDSSGLKQALRAKTFAVQRRRRWTRHGTRGLAVLALYGLGFVSSELLDSSVQPDLSSQVAIVDEEVPAIVDTTKEHTQRLAASESKDIRDPELMERRAEVGTRQIRSERFRRAGDLYLEERADVERAIRCYRRYLALAADEERRGASMDDSWLLSAMRLERKQGRLR